MENTSGFDEDNSRVYLRYSVLPPGEPFESATRPGATWLAYFTLCMDSFGSMTPRFLTILKLPLLAWAGRFGNCGWRRVHCRSDHASSRGRRFIHGHRN